MAKWYKKYSDGTVERDYASENSEAVAGGMAMIFVPLILLGLLLVAAYVIIRLYAWNVLSVIIAFVAFTVLRNVLPIRSQGARRFLSLLVAIGIGFAGFQISGAHYYTVFEKSHYSADYIQALSDGSAPLLHEKLDGKGTVLATLAIGGKVKVNGVSRDRREYNITTPEGVTGWVEAGSFPADALPKKDGSLFDLVIKQDGKLVSDRLIAFDRDLMNLQPVLNEKYIIADKDGAGNNIFESFRGLTPAAQRMAIPVNLAVSTKWISGEDILKGKAPTDMTENPDIQVVLKSIIYGAECTIILVESAGIFDYRKTGEPLFDTIGDEHEKFMLSLVMQDLDNPGSTPVNVMDVIAYSQLADGKYGSTLALYSNSGIAGMALIFPPFKTRHFSITHTEPVMEKPGFVARTALSLLSKILKKGETEDFGAWDFPEVWVR
jgi:hypothetical protein